jgi:hypothetical protein
LADLEAPFDRAFKRHLPSKNRSAPIHLFWSMAADSGRKFGVVLGWTEDLGDIELLGAFGPDSLCYVGGLGMGGGAHADPSAADRWNNALARLHTSLSVTTAAAAARTAAVAIASATGVAFDWVVGQSGSRPRTVQLPNMEPDYELAYLDSITVHWINQAWNVGGTLRLDGRRLFFVRVRRDGRLMQIFMQDPADPTGGR